MSDAAILPDGPLQPVERPDRAAIAIHRRLSGRAARLRLCARAGDRRELYARHRADARTSPISTIRRCTSGSPISPPARSAKGLARGCRSSRCSQRRAGSLYRLTFESVWRPGGAHRGLRAQRHAVLLRFRRNLDRAGRAAPVRPRGRRPGAVDGCCSRRRPIERRSGFSGSRPASDSASPGCRNTAPRSAFSGWLAFVVLSPEAAPWLADPGALRRRRARARDGDARFSSGTPSTAGSSFVFQGARGAPGAG